MPPRAPLIRSIVTVEIVHGAGAKRQTGRSLGSRRVDTDSVVV
jgi:hypothetical protein